MTDDLKERLLPCPFCGEQMENRGHGAIHVVGTGCPIGDLAVDVTKWNTRANPVQEPPSPGVTAGATGPVSDADFLRDAGMDGAKWAAGFKAIAERLGHHGMDEGWLIGWFCNAIMAGYDEAERRYRNPTPAPVVPAEGLDALIDLIGEFGREVYYLLDDCETSGPVGEEVHTITDDGLMKVSALLDRIEALPFEEAGVILGPGAMLQAALKQTITALRSAPPVGARVKPLVWKQAGGDVKPGEAFSAWGHLSFAPTTIYLTRNGWWLSVDCKTYPTLEDAKAAAQADYTSRILAALLPAGEGE